MVGIDGAFEREPCASDRAELIHLVPDGNIDLVSQTDRFDGWASLWGMLDEWSVLASSYGRFCCCSILLAPTVQYLFETN